MRPRCDRGRLPCQSQTLSAKPQIMPMMAADLRGEPGECAEEEDAEQAAVGDGGDGEADFDDVAFASDVDASRRRWRRGRGPRGRWRLGDEVAFAVVGVRGGSACRSRRRWWRKAS